MTLQELIKHLVSAGNSPSTIARNIKVTRGTIHNWLKGKIKTIRLHNTKALSDNYGYIFELDEKGIATFTPLPEELQLSDHFRQLSELLEDQQIGKPINWGKFSKTKIIAINKVLYKISKYEANEIVVLESMLKEKSDD